MVFVGKSALIRNVSNIQNGLPAIIQTEPPGCREDPGVYSLANRAAKWKVGK